MTNKDQEPTKPDRANVPPQPNEPREKEWAQNEESKAKEQQRKMQDQGRDNPNPSHPYEHGGARVPDKGSHR